MGFQRLIHTSLLNVSLGVSEHAQFTTCIGTLFPSWDFQPFTFAISVFKYTTLYNVHPDPHSALDSHPFTMTQSMDPQHWLSYWRILLLICEKLSLMLQQLRMFGELRSSRLVLAIFAFISNLGFKNRAMRLICLIACVVEVLSFHRYEDANISEDLHLD
jgi:hypothetical protein